MKFLGPIAGAAAATFILSMLAGSCNFSVDCFDQGVIRKATSCLFIEPMEDSVGIHMGFEFGEVCCDCFAVFTRESPGRRSESGNYH